MNKLIKPIKKALAEKYGYQNVSVKNGRGTAWGWVEADISVGKQVICSCRPDSVYCEFCKDVINRTHQEAEQIAREALKKEGLEFYTYCSDDGYNTDREEFLVQVNIINQ